MKLTATLRIGVDNASPVVFFGRPETEEEYLAMYKLRYDVYASRGYIDPARYPDGYDKDEYDLSGVCDYFIATMAGKTIGTVRLIRSERLPTEKIFKFNAPDVIDRMRPHQRGELGRLVIIPPSRDAGEYLPRNLVLLFLFKTLSDFGMNAGVEGGYAFVKSSLMAKLKKIRAPMHYIDEFQEHYPSDGVLFPYFHQSDDPVIPAYFLTKEFDTYVRKIFQYSMIFNHTNNGEYVLRLNAYTNLLRRFKVI